MKIEIAFVFMAFLAFIKVNAQDTMYLKTIDDTIVVSKEKAMFYKVINKNVSPVEVYTYYVNGVTANKMHYAASDLRIKQGEYEKYFYNGNIDIAGSYKNNKMEGWWIAYNKEKHFIEEKDYFENDLRTGKCFRLYENGTPKIIDQYVNDTLLHSTCYDSLKNIINCDVFIYKDESDVLSSAEVMPLFPGGQEAFLIFLYSNIKYPTYAREMGFRGKITVKLYIDIDGSVKNPRVIKDGVGGGCAEEAIRVCNLMPNWSPGMQNGIPVKVYFTFPLTFKLENNIKQIKRN